MSQEEVEVFSGTALTQISPFIVDWAMTTTVKKTAKSGGLYEKKVVVINNKSLDSPISVELTRKEYERLRILYKSGIKTFSATEGVENTKGYRPLILSGAAIFHEGGVKA